MKKNLKQLKNDLRFKYIFDQYGHNFSKISMIENLPEDFIECYINKLTLRNVCKYSRLSEKFIEKHLTILKNRFCFKLIKRYQIHLPIDFLNKYNIK